MSDKEIVAAFLEYQAREIRKGFIKGFELKWKEGDDKVRATNFFVPPEPAQFIIIPMEIKKNHE